MRDRLAKNIGLTVIDKRGKNRGVIIGVTQGHPNQLMIRTWSDTFNRYILFSKHYALIGHIPESTDANKKDPEFLRIYKESCIDLALDTNDRAWYEEIQKL